MMEKDFDFTQIGKQLPYSVPEGFFDDMEKRIDQATTVRRSAMRRWWIGVVAAAAVLTGIVFLIARGDRQNTTRTAQQETFYEQFDATLDQMSDEELQAYSDFVEDDVFIY